MPAPASQRSIGTCMTMPVFGWIGRIGRIGRAALGAEGGQDHLDAPCRGIPARGSARRRSGRRRSSRWRRRTRSRSRRNPGRRAGGRCCARRSRRGCRTGRGCGSAACRDDACSISLFGTLSGTLRSPSMSSLKASRRDGRPVSDGEGVAHPGGAGDLAERADMRQAGGAVAGLEQRVRLCRRLPGGGRPWRLPRRARPWGWRARRCGVLRTYGAS